MPIPVIDPEAPPPPGTPLQRRLVTIGGDYDDTQLVLGAVDDLGSQLYLNDLVGWDGATGTTLTTTQRPNDDGGYDSDAYLPPRLMTANVLVVAPSSEALLQTLKLIAHRVPLRTLQRMTVTEEELQLTADVKQAGDLLADRKANTARVSIPLVAPDPRRYSVDTITATTGLPVTTGGLRLPARVLPLRIVAVRAVGTIVVENVGNLETKPVFTIAGPCSPFTITHHGSGRVLRYHEAVPAGRSVVIDTAARTAKLDGVSRYVTGSWFDYVPGVNEISFDAYSYDATASLTSTHRSAWK